MKYGFLFYLCSVKTYSMRAKASQHTYSGGLCQETSENNRERDFVSANRVGEGNKPGVRSIEELDSA